MILSLGSTSSSISEMQSITSASPAKLSARLELRMVAPAVLTATKRAQEQLSPQNAESLLIIFVFFPWRSSIPIMQIVMPAPLLSCSHAWNRACLSSGLSTIPAASGFTRSC